MKEQKALQNISGLVSISDWDENGKPIQIKICAPGEINYTVIENKKGKRLYQCLQQFVKVRGVVRQINLKNEIEIKNLFRED